MDVFYIVIIICGILGFGISAYIFRQKMEKSRHLVCPIGERCDDVVESKLGLFFD